MQEVRAVSMSRSALLQAVQGSFFFALGRHGTYSGKLVLGCGPSRWAKRSTKDWYLARAP